MTKLAFLPNRKESECSKILKNLFLAIITGLFAHIKTYSPLSNSIFISNDCKINKSEFADG
jgi:hypothetical protein